ncbi:sensor histidine kinase [Desulfonatronum thioautotrophicum]|uniref:sensor histidine kinase n=1 Tax=Desulfonatronum thioautotrophicum TaxID=617001 RepID=UPI0005EAF067|nr:ABC transporter substrate binding protein [Desulfonatronum thioautotrophicum]
MARKTCVLLILAVLHLVGATWDARADSVQGRVLVLTSYHSGDAWNDGVVRGIKDILELDSGVELMVEFLDVRRRSMDSDYKAAVTTFLDVKYRETTLDLIIVADDAALDFLIMVREELFFGIPVVFCGINNFKPGRIQGQAMITGVNEEVSIRSTMELALKLFPQTERIVAILDEHSAVSRANLRHFRSVTSDYSPPDIEIQELLNLSTQDVQQRLSRIPPKSILLRLTTLLNPEGGYMSLEQSMRVISEASPVSVFTVWDFDIGHGALGGVVVSSLEQGQLAGKLAREILIYPHAVLPAVVMESPNVAMFDHQQMARFDLPETKLPYGAQILGKAPSLYAEFKFWIWIGVLIITLLTALVLVLLAYIAYRRRMTAALEESEERYRRIVETANEGIWVLDEKFKTTFVNPRMAEMLGLAPAEVLGRPRDTFMFAEDIPDDETRMKRRVAGTSESYERRFRRKDGSTLWTLVSGTPLVDAQGRIIGSFGMFADISRLKYAEEELQHTSDALRNALAEKDKFFSIIAHDLRAPMAGLLGFVRQFSEDARVFSQEHLQKILPRVKQSAEDLFLLLENLLEWATMQRGASHFKPESLGLETLVSANIELARPTADQKDVSLQGRVEPGLHVYADRHMLDTIVRNLISNAIKFTNTGGNVIVSAIGEGDSIQIRVQDDGIGMDREMAEKIFAIDQKTTRAGTGGERSTGLGLILCKEFTEKHGGRIDVKSLPGKGSTITVILPRSRITGSFQAENSTDFQEEHKAPF